MPIFQAMANNPFMAISTGTTSALYSGLHNMVRMTPLPAPIIIPTGPFRLSTHPGSGSCQLGMTITICEESYITT